MAEEANLPSGAKISDPQVTADGKLTNADAEEHYEVVSEYRIGEGPPPIFLVVAFAFVVIWAMFSWIPFFGY